jgi:hypothetical protein
MNQKRVPQTRFAFKFVASKTMKKIMSVVVKEENSIERWLCWWIDNYYQKKKKKRIQNNSILSVKYIIMLC